MQCLPYTINGVHYLSDDLSVSCDTNTHLIGSCVIYASGQPIHTRLLLTTFPAGTVFAWIVISGFCMGMPFMFVWWLRRHEALIKAPPEGAEANTPNTPSASVKASATGKASAVAAASTPPTPVKANPKRMLSRTGKRLTNPSASTPSLSVATSSQPVAKANEFDSQPKTLQAGGRARRASSLIAEAPKAVGLRLFAAGE
jgi:hypothetical protein